jgi:F-type H+-transporting ATPase subunit b
MPQLNVQDFAPQLFWLALTFILLYLIMSRIALPRVGQVLEQRSNRIAADLATAAQLREDTEKAIADYERALAEARGSAHQIARKAREEMNADIERERSGVDRQISEKLAGAEKHISALKESALGHIEQIATETAEAIVARLLGKSVKKSDLQGAVKEALGK